MGGFSPTGGVSGEQAGAQSRVLGMLRPWTSGLVAAVCVIALGGCGSSESGTEEDASSSPGAEDSGTGGNTTPDGGGGAADKPVSSGPDSAASSPDGKSDGAAAVTLSGGRPCAQ